jgi:hypothetical protein
MAHPFSLVKYFLIRHRADQKSSNNLERLAKDISCSLFVLSINEKDKAFQASAINADIFSTDIPTLHHNVL